MKKLLFPPTLFASLATYSQVGIGTISPQKTLHVIKLHLPITKGILSDSYNYAF